MTLFTVFKCHLNINNNRQPWICLTTLKLTTQLHLVPRNPELFYKTSTKSSFTKVTLHNNS